MNIRAAERQTRSSSGCAFYSAFFNQQPKCVSAFQKSLNITLDSKCRLFQNLHGSLGEYLQLSLFCLTVSWWEQQRSPGGFCVITIVLTPVLCAVHHRWHIKLHFVTGCSDITIFQSKFAISVQSSHHVQCCVSSFLDTLFSCKWFCLFWLFWQ